MARSKEVLLSFMADSPNDFFRILLPLSIKLHDTDPSKHQFKVLIQKPKEKTFFTHTTSPEVYFTHYKFQQTYKGAQCSKYYKKIDISKKIITIDTSIETSSKKKLKDFLEEKDILSLVGWNRDYIENAENIYTYLFEDEEAAYLIPQYSIAIYYYYRSTKLREATFNMNLDSLYLDWKLEGEIATLNILKYLTNEDAAYIHRFASQPNAKKALYRIGQYHSTYTKFTQEKTNTKVEEVPIRSTFPTKELIDITVELSKARYSEKEDKPIYIIHNIINDTSSFQFKYLNKNILKPNFIPESSDEKKPEGRLPQTNPKNPSRRLSGKKTDYKKKAKQINSEAEESNGIIGISFQNEDIPFDLPLELNTFTDEAEEPSDSSDFSFDIGDEEGSNGQKISISKEAIEKIKEQYKKAEHIPNFEHFIEYTQHLSQDVDITDFITYPTKKILEVFPQEVDNKKCKIKNTNRHFITVTFQYKGYYVGLIELENQSHSSTWVIFSDINITFKVLKSFLGLYIEEDMSIREIKKSHVQFKTKNHQKINVLTSELKDKWCSQLKNIIY